MSATPGLLAWIARRPPAAPGQRALVVGSDVVTDAGVVARLGFRVTTIAPGAPLPGDGRRAFALVVVAHALEAVSSRSRGAAVRAIADGVASGGTLLVLADARDEGAAEGGAHPRALAASELEPLDRAGLDLVRFEDYAEAGSGERRFRAEYRRPTSDAS